MTLASTHNTAPDAVADLARSLERLGGDLSLLRDMAGFFIEDAPMLVGQLREALDRGDPRAAAFAAHSLKGLAATFDATALQDVARRIEDQAERAEASQWGAEVASLEEQTGQLILLLKQRLLA
jgi:HPt (histidine-containing phosphotransfer) domain-containing protein